MKLYTPPEVIKRFTALIYGQTGTEKTYSIRTFPNPLVLDFEDRLACLHGLPYIKVLHPESYPEVLSVLSDPNMYIKRGVTQGAWIDDKWDTFVIDSLTAGAAMFLTSTAEAFGKSPDPSLETAIISDKWDVRRNYNLSTSRVRNVVRCVRDMTLTLNKHLVVICHEGIEKEEISGRLEGGPMLPGKLPFELPHLFDFVFRYETTMINGEPKARVQTKSIGVYRGKDSTGTLDLYEPPDFSVWWAKITKGV